MESRPNFHPVYVSGQYLTSDHLNETQNFLWQEEKATRYLLVGNGIVQGLQGDFTVGATLNKVTVTPGAASTVDGFLVQAGVQLAFNKGLAIQLSRYKVGSEMEQVLEKTEFEKIKNQLNPVPIETVLNAIEIFAETAKIEDLPAGTKALDTFAITSAQALANYLLLAWVYIKRADNDHCQQGDCNTKGIEQSYITRYFLILNSQFPESNTAKPGQLLCSVARIKNLSTAAGEAGLNQKSKTAWDAGYKELLPYFSNTDPLKQLSVIASLLTNAEQTALTAAATSLAKINTSATVQACQQYYTLFAGDLAKAINELVVFYNEYSIEYPSVSGTRIERTIIIGSLRSTGIDKWRYYFIPAPDQVMYASKKRKLKKLFLRVTALVNNFLVQNEIGPQAIKVENRPLAIPTLTGEALLQDRAIAYYYDIMKAETDNEVLKYWNPQDGGLKNIYCYYDQVAASRSDMKPKLTAADWYNYNFFRIEGHIGMKKETAASKIAALIVNEGLPIQLIECDINYKGPKKMNDWHAEFVGTLDSWMVNLRKTYKKYDYAPLKNIQDRINQTSYRNVNEVAKIANDFYAYSNLFYKTPPPPEPPPGQALKKIIPGSAYIQFKSVVAKDKISSMYGKFKEAVAEQAETQSQKLVMLKDMIDIEYMGGAPRGGTFVLLNNGVNIIGDGCLPYYYRVDPVRVYIK